MRKLSNSFMNDLMLADGNGRLYPILERVRQDETLMLAIREDYINIYYRGGNLLRVKKQTNGSYLSFFDEQYDKSGNGFGVPAHIENKRHAEQWVEAFPRLKEAMDLFLAKHNKPEREFQQVVARENNCSTISNESEYFITDIELADSGLGARFDMLAICWPADSRTTGSKCRAAIIEMKYGDGALGGTAGLRKHLEDIDSLIADRNKYGELLQTMESQFKQLHELGLLRYNECSNGAKAKLDAGEKPDVMFVLANHNPRSMALETILCDPAFDMYEQAQRFTLKFFVASYSGYGMHEECMLSLNEFRTILKSNSRRRRTACPA